VAHGERRFQGEADRLRAPERIELLEVPRVVRRCLAGQDLATALDVGTGTGVFAEAFAASKLRVAGIDPNPVLLERARALVPAASFTEGVAENLPFPDASFDLVFLGLVLHETDDPARALAEARRVTTRRVAILEWPYVSEEKGPPLGDRLDPSRIEALAAAAGFSRVERVPLSHLELFLCEAAPGDPRF